MVASIRDSLKVRVAESETTSLLRDGAAADARAGDSECCSEGAMSDSESEMSSTTGSLVARVKPKREPKAFQRVDVPGFLKRTYGVDLAYASSLEHRHKSAKFDEQLDGLRAALPDVATSLSTERKAILLDAYHYIATLHRQVEDLNAELLDDASNSTSIQTRPEAISYEGAHWSYSQEPVVDVTKRNGLFEVRVVCANRPGLLVNITEAIESRGLTITHARIACHNEIVVEYLSLENEESQEADFVRQEEEEEEEEESVKTMLLHAICRGRFDSDLR